MRRFSLDIAVCLLQHLVLRSAPCAGTSILAAMIYSVDRPSEHLAKPIHLKLALSVELQIRLMQKLDLHCPQFFELRRECD